MADTQLVANFIKTKGPEIDPAFGTPSNYDSQRAVFGPRQPIYDLEAALERYQNLGCSPQLGFDPKSCTWDDIREELSNARAEYEAKAKGGWRGSVRKAARKAGDKAGLITPALQMIPDQYGLSVVRASLGWMFALAKEASTRRESIFAAFEDIPLIIMTAEANRKDFPSDVHLRDLAQRLNDTLVNCLGKMIRYLLPKHQVAKIFPVFPNAPPGDEVDLMIGEVRRAAANLKQRSDVLVEGAILETRGLVERANRGLDAARQTGVSTLLEARGISRQVAEVGETLEPVPGQLQELQQTVEELKEEMSHLELEAVSALTSMSTHAGVDAQNWMKRLLDEFCQRFQASMLYMASESRRREEYLLGAMQYLELEIERARTPQPASTATLSTRDLLGILAVSPQGMTRDLDAIIRGQTYMDPSGQLQAQSLLRMDRFWAWLSSPSSDMLLVDGDVVDDPTQARVSPLSAVCAAVTATLVKTRPQAIPLYFYCGQHMAAEDDLRGPQGLLRCLTAKLLLEVHARHRTSVALDYGDRSAVDALRRRRVGALCAVFGRVLAQVPQPATVYLVIDGIAWYERLEMREDLSCIVRTLSALVDDPHLRPVLKILLTSPFQSRLVGPGIPSHRHVFLRATMLPHDVLPWERMMLAGIAPRASPVPVYAAARGAVGEAASRWGEEGRPAADYL